MFALEGVRVLDLSHYIAGPHCSLILADHGADVIKIEPLQGEPSRTAAPVSDGASLYFTSMNRNKRSLALDLKRPEARSVVDRLIAHSDVVVTNYAKGVPDRLHFGYDRIREINPRIVMAQITGFGLTGSMSEAAAFDGIVQAMSGISHLTGERDGPPLKAGVYIADHAAALHAAIGVGLALYQRERTGLGQLVDVSMLDAMVAMLAYEPARAHTGAEPRRSGNRSANVFATTFPTSDGYVYIAALSERMWTDLVDLIGNPALADPIYRQPDRRVAAYDELERLVGAWSSRLSTAEVVSRLRARGIPAGQVNSITDILESPQLAERGMLAHVAHASVAVPVPGRVAHMSLDDPMPPMPAPDLGADTRRLLAELGMPEDEFAQLMAAGVIAMPRVDA